MLKSDDPLAWVVLCELSWNCATGEAVGIYESFRQSRAMRHKISADELRPPVNPSISPDERLS